MVAFMIRTSHVVAMYLDAMVFELSALTAVARPEEPIYIWILKST
jgi:hypothetical protein